MAELFFIATVIFVAYVLFVVLDEKKDNPEPDKVAELKPALAEPEIIELSADTPITLVPEPEKIVAKPVRPKTATAKIATVKTEPVTVVATKPESSKVTTPAADSLKNPKTGEVAKFPSNYNFAKRWIKDALVEEGLLDKVYKNTELDDETTEKIHAALQQLKALDKYK
jgi:hypothetical protein